MSECIIVWKHVLDAQFLQDSCKAYCSKARDLLKAMLASNETARPTAKAFTLVLDPASGGSLKISLHCGEPSKC